MFKKSVCDGGGCRYSKTVFEFDPLFTVEQLFAAMLADCIALLRGPTKHIFRSVMPFEESQ